MIKNNPHRLGRQDVCEDFSSPQPFSVPSNIHPAFLTKRVFQTLGKPRGIEAFTDVFDLDRTDLKLLRILFANAKTGRIFMKKETLAHKAGCSVRTVQRHLKRWRETFYQDLPLMRDVRKGQTRWEMEFPGLLRLTEAQALVSTIQDAHDASVSPQMSPQNSSGRPLLSHKNRHERAPGEVLLKGVKELNLKQPTELTASYAREESPPPVVFPSDPLPKPSEKPSLSEPSRALATRMKLPGTLLLALCAKHRRSSEDLEDILESTYAKFEQGLIEKTPLAYIRGTLPHYQPPLNRKTKAQQEAQRQHEKAQAQQERVREHHRQKRHREVELRLDSPPYEKARAVFVRQNALGHMPTFFQEEEIPDPDTLHALCAGAEQTIGAKTMSPLCLGSVAFMATFCEFFDRHKARSMKRVA